MAPVFRPRSTRATRAIAVFLCCFFPFCSIFFWRIDEVGGKERSGLPPNSSILIIQHGKELQGEVLLRFACVAKTKTGVLGSAAVSCALRLG